MALLDFLKKKKETSAAAKAKADREKAKEAKKPVKKPTKSSVKPAAEIKTEKEAPVKAKARKTLLFSYEAVRKPHISEKASYLAEKNQYTFEISPNYNKNEVKKAVEGIYGVDVLSVNVIKIPAKKMRLGRTEGFKKSLAKAVVKIKEGQKIEIL